MTIIEVNIFLKNEVLSFRYLSQVWGVGLWPV